MASIKKPFSFEEFKSIYSKIPRLTVEVVLVHEEGILLTRRNIQPHKDVWCLPGGTVYFKETLVDATKRVAREELGIEIQVEKQLGVIEYLHEDSYEGFDHPVGVVLQCRSETEEFILDSQANEV